MRVAIVGTGIAGNVVAYRLRDRHDITVFEAADRPGGHTNTIEVEENGRPLSVDTGFIVFNDRTYPNFLALLDELGQPARPSEMSFSVQSEATGLEYKGSSVNGLFAQRFNAFRPRFLRMLRDILRFNRDAVQAIGNLPASTTVGDYLENFGYGAEFSRDYLVPMTAAIWSAEPGQVDDMPLAFLVRFFDNHGLLQIKDRPQWYTIPGGSREYLRKLIAGHEDRIRLSSPVQAVSRSGQTVTLKARGAAPETFDYVFLACHSDQALAMLADPTSLERATLGAIRYQENEAVLHTDRSLLPARRRAWAAWNYHLPADRQERVSVTYNMNILQGLDAASQYCVTLNASDTIDPEKIIYRTTYQHPVFTLDALSAQSRQQQLNCGNRTAFCGAYWRNGFHEDGVVSAIDAVRHFEEECERAQLPVRRTG